MSRFVRLILAGAVFMALMAFTPFFASPDAHASCIAPKEEGNWVNIDPNTNSITRVRVDFICQDVVLNGKTGPSYYVRLYGKCHPTDCDWGRVPARRLSSGEIYATYDHGFAKRSVWIRMSKYHADQLWVNIKTDFTDPNRADYSSQDWFRKV